MSLDVMRKAQQQWAAKPLRERLRVLRAARYTIAARAATIASAVPLSIPGALHRTTADTLIAEVLPLLEAIRFLEREAGWILRPRTGTASRPLWMRGVTTETHRVPLGIVLIIAPANYPLFLPGVQALQALAAGDAVLWKPAHRGAKVARLLRDTLICSGVDSSLITILDETNEAAIDAIHAGVDKVFLTGSATTGRIIMRELAQTLTPSVMELSGCDAVFVLEGADVARAVDALAFSMRLNGSNTCMAARRIFVTTTVANELLSKLTTALDWIHPIPVPQKTEDLLAVLLAEATALGAQVVLNGLGFGTAQNPEVCATLISSATPDMRIMHADIFAPVLSLMEVSDEDQAITAYAHCPYALTASVFGPRTKAEAFARRINAGNVLVNDVIAPTADPRASFGGRGQSGFGSTRGREGFLEMTAVKTVQIQSSRSTRHYQPTSGNHEQFFLGYLQAAHGNGLRQRWAGVVKLFGAARKLK